MYVKVARVDVRVVVNVIDNLQHIPSGEIAQPQVFVATFETTRLYVCQTWGKFRTRNKHKAFHPTVH